MVAANALRSATTRSAGTPGGTRNGRPSASGAKAACITSLSSSVATRSGANGTSCSSASFCGPYCKTAVELAPFHGEKDVVLPGIAIDRLHFRAQHRVQQPGEKGRRRIGAGDADGDFACLEIRNRTHGHSVPDEDHGSLRARRAEPIELDGIVACLLGAEQRLERRVVLNKANDAAVLLGVVVEKIGGRHSASAGHISDDEKGDQR